MKRLQIALFFAIGLCAASGCEATRDFFLSALTHSGSEPDRSDSGAWHDHAEHNANRRAWQESQY